MENSAQIEAVKNIYTAINVNDIAGALKFFDSQIEYVEPPGLPPAKAYHGLAEFTALMYKTRSEWESGGCEPQNFTSQGNKVIAYAHVKVKLKNKTELAEGNIADVFVFRNGKVIQMRTFVDFKEALAWTPG